MEYYVRIDGLRFIAITLVLLAHFATYIGEPISAAYYGVDLFFSISGFLITNILINTKGDNLFKTYYNFIIRRALRIFPIYYIFIGILLICGLPIVKDKLLWLLTYTYNYAWIIYDIPGTPVNHFWSLAVEEQFYIIWPIIVLLTKKKPNILIFFTISVILFGYSQMIYGFIPVLKPYNYIGLPTRMASLAIGGLAAIYINNFSISSHIFKNRIFEVLMLVILISSLIFNFKIKVLLLGICSFYIIIKSANSTFRIHVIDKILTNKSLSKIATVSYGIYIFHLPIEYYFNKYFFNPIWDNINFSTLGYLKILEWHSWIIKFPILYVTCYYLAKLSYQYIEMPFLRLKKNFK